MRKRRLPGALARRSLPILVALAVLLALGAAPARGERTQQGNLIVSLDGSLAPLKLPRDRLAPVAVSLEGGLQTADRTLLPRVTKVELGLPGQGVLSTRGLPTCSQRSLRNAKPPEALAACAPALVGHGKLEAEVLIPNQAPFEIDADLLAFNGRVGGRRAVILDGFSADPPTVVVLPFVVRRGSGRFGAVLVADLPAALGPLPRLAHFSMTLSRRFSYRGRVHSYLSASCPIPPSFTAGFFSFAKATYTLADGRQLSTSIARSCRAR
ncbi:MAG: hypothetical protein H0X42_02450 [Solirubrobacterales bacterium]|nr:hypothetical protein [Solirubrobacterales bacterium]